jgi:N-methylhydantoinase A
MPSPSSREETRGETLDAYSFTRKTKTRFVLVDRSTLTSEHRVSGPAIVIEPTATTFLDAGFDAHLNPSGSLLIHDTEMP